MRGSHRVGRGARSRAWRIRIRPQAQFGGCETRFDSLPCRNWNSATGLGNMRIQAFAIGLALVWATVGGARATEVLFTITGGDRTAMFELALNPTPNPGGVPGAFFS